MNDFHINNRRRLKELVNSKLIIIPSNVLIQKSLDQAYPFKQDNNFWYLTGIDEPSLILVIYGSDEFLILPTLSSLKQTFDGKIDTNLLSKTSGINQILDEKEGWQKLSKLIKESKSAATLMPGSGLKKHFGIYPSPARRDLILKIKKIKASTELEEINKKMAAVRMVKQPIELESIKRAVKITCDTLNEALNLSSLSSLKTAKELEAVITFGFINRGASSTSFDPIVAQGKQATTIHYIKNDQNLNNQELLLIDTGCEFLHYCSDISRTISLGKPSARQQDVYDAVREVHHEVIKVVKSGITFKDLERYTEKMIGKQLNNLGLIKKQDKKSIRKYYPHSVSHSLGLDVHDLCDISMPIPGGSVITIEPGIYIPKEGIGVRIEDDVLVTKSGCKVLSKDLSYNLSL